MKYETEHDAVVRLTSNGVLVKGKWITVSYKRPPGLKLLSAIDYLVSKHKYSINYLVSKHNNIGGAK